MQVIINIHKDWRIIYLCSVFSQISVPNTNIREKTLLKQYCALKRMSGQHVLATGLYSFSLPPKNGALLTQRSAESMQWTLS